MNGKSRSLLLLSLVALLLAGCGPSAAGVASPTLASAPASPVEPLGSDTPTPMDVGAPVGAEGAHAPLVGPPQNADGFARITARELAELMQRTDITLVHVHTLYEWEIPGTDLYIPADRLADRLSELPERGAPLVLYCRSGNVSQAAARFLAGRGYTNVMDLIGGYGAWYAEGYPLLDRR
jgi:rhodanese-related sulfurtransferase